MAGHKAKADGGWEACRPHPPAGPPEPLQVPAALPAGRWEVVLGGAVPSLTWPPPGVTVGDLEGRS